MILTLPTVRESLSRWRVALTALIAWWLQELREMGEAALARLIPRLATRTFVRFEGQSGTLWSLRGSHKECLSTFTCDATGAWPEKLSPPEAAAAVQGTRAIVALAPASVLRQKLTLPVSAERNLDQIIWLQLERESPMPLERVSVDYRTGKRSRTDRTIEIELLIVQRDRIERVRELARAWGLRLMRIGVGVEANGVNGNFLRARDTSGRLQLTRTDSRLTFAAALLTVLYVLLLGVQWGYERFQVGRELQRLEAPATAADHLARQLQVNAAPAQALAKMIRQPDALDLLTALTQDIPRDSWLYELEINAQWPQVPRIKLSGFTPTATKLIGELQNTGHFDDVRLDWAMSAGIGAGQDRLQLTARQAVQRKATTGVSIPPAPGAPAR
jgi:general secretion pathway protein L